MQSFKSNSVKVGIIGTGSYVPRKIITNADLEKMVDTNDQWIRERTGIIERHVVESGESTWTLGLEAGKKAIEDAGLSPNDIDIIIVGTNSPDTIFPATACRIQGAIGAENAGAFDLQAGCTSALYGMHVAACGIISGAWKNALIIGVEALSRMVNWKDRNTCVLFADGAGAVVLGKVNRGGFLAGSLHSDGTKSDLIEIPAGGALLPASHETVDSGLHYVRMKGNEVFKFVVRVLPDYLEKIVSEAGLKSEEINWWIFHQANLRIIDAVLRRFNVSHDKTLNNLDKYGNTSAASILLVLDEAVKNGVIKNGDHLVITSFGAGMTFGAIALEWWR